jgi:serine/threonine protein phosphatase PrpC
MKRLKLKVASGLNRGLIRDVNEDVVYAYVRPPQKGHILGLLIVADGMGGHQAGEVASRLAMETMRRQLGWFLEGDDREETIPAKRPLDITQPADPTVHFEDRLLLAIEEANAAIYRYAQENPAEAGNMGTTLTCALIKGTQAIIANVGDSRAYCLRGDKLELWTEDHSYVGQLIKEGKLPADAVYDHPQRNVITRALGHQAFVDIDVWTRPLQEGDRLLLCSDGLWEMIRDESEIVGIMRNHSLKEAVNELIAAANRYGGVDNIAVALAELSRDT